MKKKRLLTLLVLLITAATGAWADETPLLTIENKDYKSFTSGSMTFDDKVTVTFSKLVYNDGDNWGWFGGSATSLLTVAGTNGYTITSCKFYTKNGDAQTGHTVEGESPSVCLFNGNVYIDDSKTVKIGGPGITKIEVYGAAASSGYTVSLKDGVKDADKWTVKVGEGQAQALPIGGLEGGETVTLKYNGRLKVKAVTATTDAAPTVPEGVINSKFTINTTGDKVYFSKGNLQATTTDLGTTWTWGFAENQYTYVGETAANTTISGNGTVSTNGPIDLFSWSTSATYFGINNSTDDSDYLGDFVDWGGVPGFDAGWSTLTISEWDYLINTRSASTVNGTENARIAKAKVCDVQGLILFPDEYTHPSDVTAPVGINDKGSDGWDGNNYDATDWSKMESAGCVFLPITGRRSGNELWNLTTCYYWSSTPSGQANKCDMVTVTQSDIVITGADFAYNPGLRKSGRGVRLVYRVE